MTRYAAYYDDFARVLLAAIGAAVTRATLDGPVAWIGGEAGWSGRNVAVQGNNPLNIKVAAFRSFGVPYDGVRRITNVDDGTQGYGTFTSLERGAKATAAYLTKAPYYHEALAAIRAGDVVGFLNGIAKSPWAASHYGYPAHNHLLDNLAYVRGSVRPTPPPPEAYKVKFIQLSSADVAGLPSISVPADTPIETFDGEQWTKVGPTNLRVLPGLVDAHSNRRAVVISTGRFYADGKQRPTAQVAVIA